MRTHRRCSRCTPASPTHVRGARCSICSRECRRSSPTTDAATVRRRSPTRDTTPSTISSTSWTKSTSEPVVAAGQLARRWAPPSIWPSPHPERVAGLILLAPGVSGAPEIEFDEITALLFDGAVRGVRSRQPGRGGGGRSSDLARRSHRRRRTRRGRGSVAGAGDRARPRSPLTSSASGSSTIRGSAAWDRIGRLTVPVTVACGLLDVPAVIDESRAIADRIPGARFTELEDVAHLPSLEAPERVAELVRRAVLAT